MPREVSGLFVGNAGEFYVLAELTRRGWTAALTARNNHAFDILARRSEASVAIRVKSKTSGFNLFQWNAKKSGDIFLEMSEREDFSVLVDVPADEESTPSF